MVRLLICDDDSSTALKIKAIVDQFLKNNGIRGKIHTFTNANEISDQMMKGCDIALLDVDLECDSINGMDIARRLRKFRPDSIIIFVTNFIEYAPEGYYVQAFRYILKSTLDSELLINLQEAIKELDKSKETFKVKINGEIINIPFERILYFEVRQHDITACCKGENRGQKHKTYIFREVMTKLESDLETHGFLRIHKSFLVNMSHIKVFNCRGVTLTDGMNLRVGEKKYMEQKKKYLLWKGMN